jgi:hypothetical protein
MSGTRRLALALIGVACLATACSHAKTPSHASSTTTTASSQSGTTSTVAVTTTTTAETSTTTASSIGPLVTRTPPGGAYSVSLPASWTFANTSVPSDHQTNVWTDPSDANTMLTVVLSGCAGCVKASSSSNTPDPQGVLPSGATVTETVQPWQIFYSAGAPSGYTDYGTIIVSHSGTTITGYTKLDLVIPTSDSAVADDVLAGFSLS